MLVGLLLGLTACPAPRTPAARIPPVSTGKVRVRVFTEPSAVTMLAPSEPFVFVATANDVERFDQGGSVYALSSVPGAAGKVLAMASDAERRQVWIVTDGGVARYETRREIYARVLDPPPSLELDFAALAKDGGVSIAAASDGGAWIGTPQGLFYVSAQGGWTSTPIKDPIRALLRDHSGWLWIATATGLLARTAEGDTVRLGAKDGQHVTRPRLLVELPGARTLVIGTDASGHERLALGQAHTWGTYRALPEVTWDAAVARGAGVVVMGGGRVYRLGPADPARVRPLARDGLRLVPTAGAPAAPWVIDPLDVVVPPGATSLGIAADQLLIGTRELGTARYRFSADDRVQPQPIDWLRRKQMFQDATTLSVACTRVDDCWVATGAQKAWHWTGNGFQAGGPDEVVLGVVRAPDGAIVALHRAASEPAIRASRIDRTGAWIPIPNISVTTPGAAAEVSFARFANESALWIGLRYRDGLERRAFGIAILDLDEGTVGYHRTDPDGDKRAMLPVPIGVVDGDVRGDTAWFATNEGVARLRSGEVQVWTEAEGLRSELARAVTIAPSGKVIIATGAGAGIWDGKVWTFPAALRFDINDAIATRNGQVWMATDRGIAAWDGTKVRRVDVRRGLAENAIVDVAVDQFDRVWARGAGSLTLISQ